MAYSIFVSHCMAKEDEPLVRNLVSRIARHGVEAYLAERDLQPGRSLSAKILGRIRQCDMVTVLWTRCGSLSEWVNQEIGAARDAGKAVVPLVEKGVHVKGLLEGVERIEFDRSSPDGALESLEEFLIAKRNIKDARDREKEFWGDVGVAAAVATVLVATLVIALLAARR